MARPQTVLELERNDLTGAIDLYWDARRRGQPLTDDDLRIVALSFDDSGRAFAAAIERGAPR